MFCTEKKKKEANRPYADKGATDPGLISSLPGQPLSSTLSPPQPGEGIRSLQGTLELLGPFTVSLDELIDCALTLFSRVLIELEDLCLRAPWAGPIRKCSTKHA